MIKIYYRAHYQKIIPFFQHQLSPLELFIQVKTNAKQIPFFLVRFITTFSFKYFLCLITNNITIKSMRNLQILFLDFFNVFFSLFSCFKITFAKKTISLVSHLLYVLTRIAVALLQR